MLLLWISLMSKNEALIQSLLFDSDVDQRTTSVADSIPESEIVEPEVGQLDFDQFSKLWDDKRIVNVQEMAAVMTDSGHKVDVAKIVVRSENGSTQQYEAFGQDARRILYLARNNQSLSQAQVKERKIEYAQN